MSAQPVPVVAGWPVAFRGSSAVAAEVVTAKVLRGPRFLRVFPDIYVRRGAEPPALRLRSLAAYRYVEGRGVLSGHSAALLLGADCAGPDAPAEVTVPGGGQREHPGLRVHRGALPAAEIVPCRGTLVTSPVRPAPRPAARPRRGSGSTRRPTSRPERVLLDAGRYTRLVDTGWRIYRFTKHQVYAEPDEIAAVIGRALCAR